MTRQEFEQEQYEEVLSAHWHKIGQLKELIGASRGSPFSALREKSIADRQKELARIENQKLVLEQLGDWLIVPDWYVEKMKELKYEVIY